MPGTADELEQLLHERSGLRTADLVAANIGTRTALLINTAYSANEVTDALNVDTARVRQLRRSHSLWAIPAGGTWIFPALQFGCDERTRLPCRQIRGLDQVFPALPPDLHPAAVAGFP